MKKILFYVWAVVSAIVLGFSLAFCQGAPAQVCIQSHPQYGVLYYSVTCGEYEETKYGPECLYYTSSPVYGVTTVCDKWGNDR